jgi:hypothetical protein
MSVLFYLLIAGLLVIGFLTLAALGIHLTRSLRRFGMVRGWLGDYLAERTGRLAARSAALGVAFAEFRQDSLGRGRPRTIDGSLERGDHRA